MDVILITPYFWHICWDQIENTHIKYNSITFGIYMLS